MMKYNQLGKSALQVSEIGFGCMSLKGTEAENIRLINNAVNAGINFFDTADLYDKGQNEITVGKAIKDKRKEIILATKAGNQWREDGSGWDWNPRKQYILHAAEKSLQRLQTDYIDLYQLHGGTINDPITDTIEAFEILKQQGKIREYGISSIRPNVIREYIKLSGITSVMMQYSLLDRRPEEECINLLHEHNIGILARGSLAQGLLAGKPAKDYLHRSADLVQAAAAAIHKLSFEKRNATQTAIRFAIQKAGVSSVIVGIKNEEQLHQAVKTADTALLTESEIDMLIKASPATLYTDHR